MKKKFKVTIATAAITAMLAATSVFAALPADRYENNDNWYSAYPMYINESSEFIFGTFHKVTDADYYSITGGPSYNTQVVYFTPPDNKDYGFAVYKKSDFESAPPGSGVMPIVHKVVSNFDTSTSGNPADLYFGTEPGVTYIVSVVPFHYNIPTNSYNLWTGAFNQ
ncbi:hypothetical protein [Paenibacillus sp. L3-i20]|uniref:hypothetical protein n=1 Tax=Paenibacillus sp. L3-i20 TaxID=2905833 RepID=UPI001EE13E76|nr:hypothetical protein [Paenibacillus sp. L3-i20]GKU80175.1 hypothetical protein L3i20_v245720 [Paenibacillus sp. L3-i20]